MLKNLNPLLTPELLYVLRAMGHGDEMEVVGKPGEVLEVHQDLKKCVDKFSDRDLPMGSIERHAFYERAKKAYAVVSTTERRPYGCFILVKGVIGPDGNVM